MIDDNEVVGVNAICLARDALEQTGFMQAVQPDSRSVFFVDRNDLDCRRVRQERPNDQPGAIAQRVHTEQSVRRPMLNIDKAREFFGRQDHGRHCGTVNFQKTGKKAAWSCVGAMWRRMRITPR